MYGWIYEILLGALNLITIHIKVIEVVYENHVSYLSVNKICKMAFTPILEFTRYFRHFDETLRSEHSFSVSNLHIIATIFFWRIKLFVGAFSLFINVEGLHFCFHANASLFRAKPAFETVTRSLCIDIHLVKLQIARIHAKNAIFVICQTILK